MKKFILLRCFAIGILSQCLVIGISVHAQPSSTDMNDSLWGVWIDNSKPDPDRLQALEDFIWSKFLFSNPDSAIYYTNLQYDYALNKGEKKHLASSLSTRGIAHEIKGDFFIAINYYNQSKKICEEIGNKSYISSLLNNIGINYARLGNYDMALIYFKNSFLLKEEIGDIEGTASSLNNIGLIYREKGDLAQAVNYFNLSIPIAIEAGDQRNVGASLSNLALIYGAQGDYSKAIEYYTRGLKIEEDIANKKGMATILNGMGMIFLQQKDYPKAIDYFTKCHQIFEEIGDKFGATTVLNDIGEVQFLSGDYDLAFSNFSKSLEIGEAIQDRLGIISTLNSIGNYYFVKRDYTKSIEFSSRSFAEAQEVGDVKEIRLAASSLYKTYIKIGEESSALKYLSVITLLRQQELNFNFFSLTEHQKELYFSIMEEDFGRYFDFTLSTIQQFENLADTAYNLALQNKGLTLKSSTAMRSAILNSGDSLLITDYENWIQIKRKISELYSGGEDTKDLENEANELEKELVEKSAAFSDFDKIKKLDWKQIRSSLKTGECAIEFEHFKSEIDTANPVIYVALLVKPECKHPEIIRLCNESDLVEILGTFQGNNLNFVNTVYGTREEAQTALYQKIWQPLEKSLEGINTVYYSPSGLLHKISFASISKSQNVFLSDIYNFRQMGSTGKVAMPEDVAFSELENFLLMGGVNYNSVNSDKQVWSYLPGSLQETESINSLLIKKKFGVNYFHSNNASEEIFKEKIVSSSIVHIATHGFFFPDPEKIREEMKAGSESNQDITFRGSTNYANWSFVNNKNPLMRSGIVLANANDVWERDPLAEGEDGILTAQEVSNLDLSNTKLVVLSACETGLGDIKGSEGVYGLQRAFKMAGVNYLIMSLWQVPDKETSEFMQLFYKNLITFKDIPIAFQKTQKAMRKKYDPYYWGAFVLIE